MNELIIAAIPDIHVGAKVMSPFVLYETVMLEINNKLMRYPKHIDMIVLPGDLFDTKFPEDSDEAEVAKMIITDLSTRCSKLVIFKGTEGHDRDMLNILKPMTKYGSVYEADTSRNERQLINKIKSIKELVISGKQDDVLSDVKRLVSNLSSRMNEDSDNEIYIFEKPTFMTIKGYKILFCPEVYDTSDEYMTSLFDEHPDIVFYHGMMEGGLEHYHETKTALIYNRSITLSKDNLKKVRLFTVGGHIHGSVSILPFIPNKEMSEDKIGLKAWYVGNSYQSTFSDAGMKKGFDIIEVVDDRWVRRFMECTSGPKFHIFNYTNEVRLLDIMSLNALFVKTMKNGGHIRIDIDTSNYTDDDLHKLDTIKTQFQNLKYKIYNSKENILKEGNIKHKHNALINRPIKDIILELAEGEITEEDYKFFFEED